MDILLSILSTRNSDPEAKDLCKLVKQRNIYGSTALRYGSFLEKNIEKSICFWKSNIPVVNWFVDSTNMIKVTKKKKKKRVCKELYKRRESFLPDTDNF